MGLAGSMPEYGLVTIVWIATGLAGCFVVARTAIRIKKIEKLHVDDYIIYAAFLVLVVNAVLQTLQAPHCYNLARLVNGLSTLTEEETMASGNICTCIVFYKDVGTSITAASHRIWYEHLLISRPEDMRYEFTIIGVRKSAPGQHLLVTDGCHSCFGQFCGW